VPVSSFLAAALAGQRERAINIAREFMEVKNSRATVISDLFQGAQQQVADMWHVGFATAADEYRVSLAIEAAMAALPPVGSSIASGRGSRILLATLAPERHDLGLRLVSMALADDGWAVDFALATNPVELVGRAYEMGAGLVGISCTYVTRRTNAQLTGMARSLHEIGLPLMVGGAGFVRVPDLAVQIHADALAPEARSAVILARRVHVATRPAWSAQARAS
jgi:methanogenic corrinoid protein MtbC1